MIKKLRPVLYLPENMDKRQLRNSRQIYIETLFIVEAYLAYFTTLIYHKVLINNKTEQDTEQDTTYRYDQRSRMPTLVAL